MKTSIRTSLNDLKNAFNDAYIKAQIERDQEKVLGIKQTYKKLNEIFPDMFVEVELDEIDPRPRDLIIKEKRIKLSAIKENERLAKKKVIEFMEHREKVNSGEIMEVEG